MQENYPNSVFKVSKKFSNLSESILQACVDFDFSGIDFKNGRNTIKLFHINDTIFNIKSYKAPTVANQFIYKHFRPSKASRSFTFAQKLLANDISTPEPVAYYDTYDWWGIKRSFYVSIHQSYDFTFGQVIDAPNKDLLMRYFAKFCFDMHEKGIEFKDHSSGNTLFKRLYGNHYKLYLVDLNRMSFHNHLSAKKRMQNMSRLGLDKEMAMLFCEEYARFYNHEPEILFEILWGSSLEFQYKYWQEKQFMKKIKRNLEIVKNSKDQTVEA